MVTLTPLRGELPEWAPQFNDGSGYGYGYGYGYSDGSGDGSGDGYGSGYGDGYGYGYGNGYGYGYGYGDGSGYGYGYGYGAYWHGTIRYFANSWEEPQRQRLNTLSTEGALIAFWGSDDNGLPSNGGTKIKAAAPGVVHTVPGPIKLCTAGTLHATLLPPKWKGERWWIVALIGEVVGDEEKYGALRREIIGEAL